METAELVDQTVVLIPADRAPGIEDRRLRRRWVHFPSSSVSFVAVATIVCAATLSIALLNAAQVAELRKRVKRLEDGGWIVSGGISGGDGRVQPSVETEYYAEPEDLITGDLMTRMENIFRNRQKRDAAKPEKKKDKTPKGKASQPSAIHLNLNVEASSEQMQIVEREGVVTLGYGNLTKQGFRPKKEAHGGFTYKPWKVANWSLPLKDYSFEQSTGKVKVQRKGLYHIYSQILYHNSAARSSYAIMVNDELFVKCMSSVDAIIIGHSADNARYKTCYVGAARKLDRGDFVWIKDMYGHPVSLDSSANFFGLIKFADLDK